MTGQSDNEDTSAAGSTAQSGPAQSGPATAVAGPGGAFLPRRAPIDAYGNGGFRFADMSHRGSLLILPSGIYGWSPADPLSLQPSDFELALAEADGFEFLLLGTGETQIFPSAALRSLFEEKNLGLEPMTTGSAARTFNVLLAEQRAVAAALIATD